jgi:rhodanese-related sulfurtransferase
MTVSSSGGYAGDIAAEEAYALLAKEKSAILIDVRTTAEWNYVGVADLSGLDKEPVLIEWQEFPSMRVAENFAGRLSHMLEEKGVEASAPLLFLCRSGVRSRSAAIAMTKAGHARCLNVAEGFEGPPDDHGHRGRVAGWKARDLPWRQG